MENQKIIIEITESNVPPKVIVNGQEVKVIALNYKYETKTAVNSGEHKFNLVMPSIIEGVFQTQGVAFDRSMGNT